MAAGAYRNLGILYRDEGDPDRALQYFQQAARARNPFPEAHHDLGIVYLRKQMNDQSIEEFRTTLAQQADYGPAVLNLALAYQNKGDTQAARDTLNSYLQRFGNSGSPFIQQARERLGLLK